MHVSGSKMTRFWACPASAVLPQTDEYEEPTGKELGPMAKGRMIHKFLEDWLNIGREAALCGVTDSTIKELCESINPNDVPWLRDRESTTVHPDCRYYAEVAFAYSVTTGEVRHLGNSIERKYTQVHPDEIPITIDVVGIFSDHVHVPDYKTGKAAEGYTAAVRENYQLMLGALCATRFYRRSSARVSINHVHDNGHVSDESTLLTSIDLDAFADELKTRWKQAKQMEAELAAGRLPNVHRGPWCRFCNAAASCPSVIALVRAAASNPESVATEALMMLEKGEVSPELATKAYQRWRELKMAVDRVGKALIGYSQKYAIYVGNGKVYGPRVVKRNEIDGIKAWSALNEVYGQEVANAAVSMETSKSAIQDALKIAWKKAKDEGTKVTQKQMLEEVMDGLTQVGAVTTREQHRTEEYEV